MPPIPSPSSPWSLPWEKLTLVVVAVQGAPARGIFVFQSPQWPTPSFNNICIKEGNEWKAAFKTPLVLVEPTVMTFGLCNTPATFQTFMNNIFEEMIDTGHVIIYLDDILIFAEDLTTINNLSSEVLSCLEKYDLYLKPEKCSFAQTSIVYLGIIISEGQIKMDLAKVKGITDWPTPRTVKQVQAFLGFCNFY